MKFAIGGSLAAVLIGTLSLSGGTHLPAASDAAAAPATYGGAALMSQAGSKAIGAVAIVRVVGHLSVYVSVSGLAPGSSYAEHIHSGHCGSNGPIVHPLSTLVADAMGRASSYTAVSTPKIPQMGWYVNVHNQAGVPIACGNVFTPDLAVPLHAEAGSKVTGVGIVLGNMDTRGGMGRRNAGAEVVVLARGLATRTIHASHFHKGICTSNGPIVLPLNSLVADSKGDAVAATYLSHMAAVKPGLYLNVHGSDGRPIACGIVTGTMPMGGM